MKRGSKHSKATRALLSKKMRKIYANGDLRARVAKRTAETWRDGTRNGRETQLAQLNEAWLSASPSVRVAFLTLRLAAAPAAPPTGGERPAKPPNPPILGSLSK